MQGTERLIVSKSATGSMIIRESRMVLGPQRPEDLTTVWDASRGELRLEELLQRVRTEYGDDALGMVRDSLQKGKLEIRLFLNDGTTGRPLHRETADAILAWNRQNPGLSVTVEVRDVSTGAVRVLDLEAVQ